MVLEHRYFLVLLVGLFIVLRRRLYEYHVQIELTWEEQMRSPGGLSSTTFVILKALCQFYKYLGGFSTDTT